MFALFKHMTDRISMTFLKKEVLLSVRRITGANLLVAPAVAVVIMAASSWAAYAREPVDVARFESQILAYEAEDMANPPVEAGGTVFVGSSSIRMWTSLEDDFQECGALNRGFGGATIIEVIHYAERIVLKHKPGQIVFFAGTNDIAETKSSGQEVYQDFLSFLATVRAELPHARIHFVSMSPPAPARMGLAQPHDIANRLIREHARRTGEFGFIDVGSTMKDGEGKLKSEYYLPDRLHLNQAGYSQWASAIKAALACVSG